MRVAGSLEAVHTHTPIIIQNWCTVWSNNLENEVVLIKVAKKLKRNINVINRDSILYYKARDGTCF